ncbi:hypothetical protein ScPMuIL_005045 [Solemya velum]
MNNKCHRCGKPVYHAERKTSIGKNWHPNCLKCENCGKILSPGQHAEHKGLPYCNNPCYKALFGPQMMGYGSNVVSPANYRKSTGIMDVNSSTLPPERRRLHQVEKNGYDHGTMIYESRRTKSEYLDHVQISPTKPASPLITNGEQELEKRIKVINDSYKEKRSQLLSVHEEEDGSVLISGPVRIYWGVLKPIQLHDSDDVPAKPTPNWRHSVYTDGKGLANSSIPESPKKVQSPVFGRGVDDSIISTPTDGVVRRRNIKKFNTVAYRGDRPTKWKRASINGHIYNYDTRVFIPVLGSCTSVTVTSNMSTSQVIKALLDKFKIDNSPEEYSLHMVTDGSGEKPLKDTDIPLVERISLGADESNTKIFLRDRFDTDAVESSKPSIIKLPVTEEEEEEETPHKEEHLPHEIEQLVILPEAVLRGIMKMFRDDEEKDVQRIKARYTVAKRRIKERLNEIKLKE